MLASRTVLILGAGASLEYGLPTGKQLLNAVHQLCLNPQTDQVFSTLLGEADIPLDTAGALAADIQYGWVTSIDSILARRSEYVEVGKAAIARVLLPMENAIKLTDLKERQSHWYPYLFDRMLGPDVQTFSRNPLTIITFNYGRSLEAYLTQCLKIIYRLDEHGVENALSGIPIIHLHGQLGTLRDNPYGTYSSSNHSIVKALHRARAGIRVIHEVNDADSVAEFIQARKALEGAPKVVFLGFGYHPENLRRLKIQGAGYSWIGGTAFELTGAEKVDIGMRIAGDYPGSKRIKFGERDQKILEFLREMGCLEVSSERSTSWY